MSFDGALPADQALSVKFWGTRGSLPRCGAEYQRYGGNTTCVEVRVGRRLFLIDAGSGIADAGKSMMDDGPQGFDILLSHLHHDHISGLPFFIPALKTRCEIRLHCGNLDGVSPQAAFDLMFAPPLFPVRLEVFPGQFSYHGFHAGAALDFGDGIVVRTCALDHPGGATAYRFDHKGRSLCYISDVEHRPGIIDDALVSFCRDADLVVYDTMFNEAEFQDCRGWGHSTWGAGVALCRAANAKRLGATHHHMRHTDDMLDGVAAQVEAALPGSFVAREGQTIRLEARVLETAA
ncbi:MBL fold metallo-hydrolase [Lichenihabitans sp. Uapishka_5]|uniref:MBL fold metallo-hydrolase n=1 Tax=Lichenihabitans sp. Uapishka_5 TaxID=3037302 RepID=UPI0029E81892|nr:MBL fold metallo-hydrolase [Lichenihabitans sp. Uapishka_5]MDX7949953.1 MBL fold metallo-hydrolase [Lichenihabitans sp. Uapishka_5]